MLISRDDFARCVLGRGNSVGVLLILMLESVLSLLYLIGGGDDDDGAHIGNTCLKVIC